VPDSQDHPSIEPLARVQRLTQAFRGPAAIVWGDRDPVLGRVLSWMSQLLPHAPVTRTQAGHFLQEEVPDEIARISIPLGSITVDGVSLTVNAISAPGTIQISLIPFTLEHTTLGERRVGDRVHLEGDTIGKYVAAMMKGEGGKGKGGG